MTTLKYYVVENSQDVNIVKYYVVDQLVRNNHLKVLHCYNKGNVCLSL